MKKLLVCICALIMAFMFVSCQTPPKATPEASKPGEPLVPGSLNLNGKWKGTAEWKNEFQSGTVHSQNEIVQKGMEITILNITSGSKRYGTLKGNIIHMESTSFYDPEGIKISLPARKFHISQDGNTLTTKFNYTWERKNRDGPGSVWATFTRK